MTDPAGHMEQTVGNLETVHSSIRIMQLHIYICIYEGLGCSGFSI